MAIKLSIESEPAPEDLARLTEGTSIHGRANEDGGDPAPIACLARDEGTLVAGASGRSECERLFVTHVWVEESRRGQGLGSRVLAELEAAALGRGCRDVIVETLSDDVALQYQRRGYRVVTVIEKYLGRLDRTILMKELTPPASIIL